MTVNETFSSSYMSFSWLTNLFNENPKMAFSATFGTGVIIYYLLEVVKQPIFVCRPTSQWRMFLQNHLSILQEKYWPTPWCFESRAQTILASVLRSRLPSIEYKREIIKLRDGGEICLDWLEPQTKADGLVPKGEKAPIVVLLPGLTGHSQSEYIKSFVMSTRAMGVRCVVFNNRGRGGIALKTARTYCAANSDDFEEALQNIKSKFPDAKVVATGISLGGMILGNYLVTRGEQAANYLEAAMVLSIPWNVFIGTESLEKPLWNLLLNRHLAQCLCESVRHMKHAFEGNHPWDLDFVMQSKTIREFDTRFTAVQFGFRDVEDYYRTACLHDKLHNIRVPLICLSAADDPFQPFQGIPVEDANKSSHVAIVITSRGGHIGFMEGIIPSNNYYSDRFFSQLLHGIFTDSGTMQKVKEESEQWVLSQSELNGCL